MTAVLRVTALMLYPVKSLAGVALADWGLEARGLRGDRRWGVVDASGAKVTAREVPTLLGLRAAPVPSVVPGSIRLSDRAGDVLEVRPPTDAEPVPVTHSGQGAARPAGPEADAWLTERVGSPVRLVWQDETSSRPVWPELGGRPGDTNSLSDAAPILLTSNASLARLNEWLAESGSEPIGDDRFRPNVVVDGDEPFAEDVWDEVTIGGVPLRRTMVCDRCVMTTIDRDSLSTSKEPIRTLARHRRWDGATWFGIRLTPLLPLAADARVAVGDDVEVRPAGH